MWQTLREHMAEFAADTFLRRVLPSLLMGWAAELTRHLRWVDTGRPILSEKSVEALVGLTILGTHYLLHLWFYLKRKAAQVEAANAQTTKGG